MAKRKKTGAQLGRDLVKMVEQIQRAAEKQQPKQIKRAVRKVQPEVKRTVRAVTPLPNADPYTQLREAGALDRKGRQKNAGPPRKPSEKRHFVRQADGKVRVVTAKQRRKLVREGREQAANYKLRKELMPWLLADKAKPSDRGEADTKVAGINIDKITGKGKAAAIDVLEETTRPIHGIAGGTRAVLRGEDPLKAVAKGLANEERYGFTEVLKELGVEGKGAAIAGLAADIGLDPTTYVTLGASAPAKFAGKAAAKGAGKKVGAAQLKTGAKQQARRDQELDRAVQRMVKREERRGRKPTARQRKQVEQRVQERFGAKAGESVVRRARRNAEARGAQNRGIQVKAFGKSTSGAATAKASQALGISAAAKAAKERPLVQDLGAMARPDFRKAGVPKGKLESVQGALREARAEMFSASRRLEALVKGFEKQFTSSQYEKILDAIESGSLKALKEQPDLYQAAVRLRSEFRHMNRLERQAGVRAGQRKNYVAHVRRQDVEPSPKTAPVGSTARSVGAGSRRKIDKTLAELREESPHLFTEQVPQILAKRGGESLKGVASARLERKIAAEGRPLTKRSNISLGADEAVYHLAPKTTAAGHGLRKVEKDSKVGVDEIAAALEKKGKPGQYVILNEKLADDALAAAKPAATGNVHKRYRKVHGTMKTLLTMPMPSYHMRNLYGDAANAWLGQNVLRLGANIGRSGKAMKELRKVRKTEGDLTAVPRTGSKAGTKIDGEHRTYLSLLEEAEKHGGLNAGFSRDLLEMIGENPGRLTSKLRNVGELRENLVRFATYLGARQEGLTAREASKRATDLHFDYADLTKAERGARDILPFYTFTARNTPLQVKKLFSKPGRYATYQKIIENAAKAAGLPPDWQQKLKDYQALGVPIPVPGWEMDAKKVLAMPGLPVMDLNRLSANPAEQFFLTAQMATGFKALPEIIANYSIFFRGEIDTGHLVAAPDWLHRVLPKDLQETVRLEKVYDPTMKKKVWKYDPKWDYALRQLPETSLLFNLTSTGKNRRGQDKLAKVIALSGVRPEQYDPLGGEAEKLKAERDKVEARLQVLYDQNINSENPTKEYTKVYAKKKKLDDQLDRITVRQHKAGDPVELPESAKPSKSKSDDPLGIMGGGASDDPLGLKGSKKRRDPLGIL